MAALATASGSREKMTTPSAIIAAIAAERAPARRTAFSPFCHQCLFDCCVDGATAGLALPPTPLGARDLFERAMRDLFERAMVVSMFGEALSCDRDTASSLALQPRTHKASCPPTEAADQSGRATIRRRSTHN